MADPVKAEAERARGREKMRRKRETDADGVNAYQRQWRAANPGKGAAYSRKSYRKNDGAARVRAARQANPELVRAVARTWRAANSEKCAGYSHKWRTANPGKSAQYNNQRRALKLNASTGEAIDYPSIYAAHDDCYLCSYPLTNPMHMDHVVPLSKGGSHTTSNLMPTHARCNLRKNDALLSELSWYQGQTDLGHTL